MNSAKLETAALLVLLALCSGLGCRLMETSNDEELAVAQSAPAATHIIYRTRTDRLNVTGGRLPSCSIATLQIVVPHPHGKLNAGLATLTATPCTADATPFPENGLTSSIANVFHGDDESASAPVDVVGTTDVPLWQIESMIKSLEKLNFFDRKRTVLSADVFLSVKNDRYAVGKRYRPVDELDALVLSAAATSSMDLAEATFPYPITGESTQTRPPLTRLPQVEMR